MIAKLYAWFVSPKVGVAIMTLNFAVAAHEWHVGKLRNMWLDVFCGALLGFTLALLHIKPVKRPEEKS